MENRKSRDLATENIGNEMCDKNVTNVSFHDVFIVFSSRGHFNRKKNVYIYDCSRWRSALKGYKPT